MKSLITILSSALLAFSPAIFADDNLGDGFESEAVTTLSRENHGVPVCTAAVPADGIIQKCFACNKSLSKKISTGTYEVFFHSQCSDVRSSKGMYRYVQPDTLSIGSLASRTCTTADRLLSKAAVWVVCYDTTTGALTDTPFMLTVTR